MLLHRAEHAQLGESLQAKPGKDTGAAADEASGTEEDEDSKPDACQAANAQARLQAKGRVVARRNHGAAAGKVAGPRLSAAERGWAGRSCKLSSEKAHIGC